jgi:hypothetical protein
VSGRGTAADAAPTAVTYKVLDEHGRPFHGGRSGFVWPLPNGKPGAWKTVRGNLDPCKNGLHLCRRQDLVRWLGPTIWLAEYDGEMIEAENKIVVRKARLVERVETWNETTARLFAADCAEAVVYLIPESQRAPFTHAIETARLFARGGCDDDAMAAARAAARAAAMAASKAATLAATLSGTWTAAKLAALAAAWAAACVSAWAAACVSAWAVQTELLFDYLEGRRT